MTKAYKVEHFERIELERDRFMIALHDVLDGAVIWSNWHREPDSQGKYRVGLSRVDAPHGGLVLVTYRHPGQSDQTSVSTLESLSRINPAVNEAMWEARRKHDAKQVA